MSVNFLVCSNNPARNDIYTQQRERNNSETAYYRERNLETTITYNIEISADWT